MNKEECKNERIIYCNSDLAYLDEILETFVEIKVRGATIIESQGMASWFYIVKEWTLMQGLFKEELMKNKILKTIFTVIPDEENLKKQ